jgi:uncharacterized protein YecE (DUF72 family)
MAGRIVIGTSGWADPGFAEEWYPQGLPSEERLPWYAEQFEAVELNSSYYAVPPRETAARWAEVTPPGFRFDVKLHRLLSHHPAGPDSLPPDLRGSAQLTPRGGVVATEELQRALAAELLRAVEPLDEAGRLSAFLLQLSPQFAPRLHALEELDPVLETLAPHRVAVEVRHRGWTRRDRAEQLRAYLERWDAALVNAETPVGDLAYLRLFGAGDADELLQVALRARALAREASEVHVYVNARGGEAPRAARRLRELLGQVEPAGVQLRLAG